MKRWMLFLGMIACLLLTPHFNTVFGAETGTGVAAEEGFHMVTLSAGRTAQLSASELTTKLIWRSSAPSVVQVDSSGKVTALSDGSAVVYASSVQDSSLFDSWVIEVSAEPSSIGTLSLDYRNAGLTVGQSLSLTAAATGTAYPAGEFRWSSSDTSVASVSQNGTITALAQGSAVIYVTTENGRFTASCMVYVIDKSITLNVSNTSLPTGKTLYDKSSSLGSGKIIWTTSDSSVAIVRRGFIEAVGEGKATISAITESGAGAQCVVTVTPEAPVYSAYMNPNNPIAGQENSLIVVASPSFDSIHVKIISTSSGDTVQDFSVDAGYIEKTASDRTVRLWTIPVTIEEAGSYTVECTSEGAAQSYSFCTLVAGPASVENTSSEGTETVSPVGVVQSWYTSTPLLRFLTEYEGLCPTVIYDVVNVPTIGYGQALFAGSTFYNNQTSEEAWGNMCKLINETFVPQLNKFILRNNLQLNQAQFDALISYSYNMGAYCWNNYSFKLRTLLMENPDVTQIDPLQLKYAFGKQSWTGGSFYTGLFRRRMDEWEMFLKKDYEVHSPEDLTGDFEIPCADDRKNPEKYGSDWAHL